MPILIANIGTSDLAVKIGDYYIPIGFDRSEPNLDKSGLDEREQTVWRTQQEIIATQLCPEIGVAAPYNEVLKQYKFSFLDLTKRLLELYRECPNDLHDRLRPARIFSVFEKALSDNVKTVFLFVTQQKPPHFTDTIYLFELLQRWFARQYGSETVAIEKVVIPTEVSAIDLDGLFNEYYKFFLERDPEELALISIKGGTPQMQTALRVQAISSNVTKQIYLEPHLSIQELLAGKPSDCQTISYWRYQRIQRYQTVKQLLNRWDFDGARTLLQEWQETLKSIAEKLESSNAPDLVTSRETIDASVRALNMAIGYLNFDSTFAKSEYERDSERLKAFKPIVNNYPTEPGEKNKHYPKLLNLYTQCCIFWNGDRVADFLTRIGLFYEETLHELIYAFGGDRYFNRPRDCGDWILNTEKLLNYNPTLAQSFYEIEKAMGEKQQRELNLERALKKNHCITGERWQRPLPGKLNKFKLPGRITKRNFVEALLGVERRKADIERLVQNFKALDYWCLKRNKLVHGASGISKQRMEEVLQEDRWLYSEEQPEEAWIHKGNKDIKNSVGNASEHDEILKVMTEISRLTLDLMGTREQQTLLHGNPGYFDPNSEPYYIYSEIRDWVKDTLERDL